MTTYLVINFRDSFKKNQLNTYFIYKDIQMKKYLFLAQLLTLSAFFHTSLLAQDKSDTKTLLGDKLSLNAEDFGFFIAPSLGFTQLDGASASLFNLRAGTTIKDKFSLGTYLSTTLNDLVPESETVPNVYMDYWSLGGFVEYSLASKEIFHVTLPLTFGYGEVQMDNEMGDADLGEANFFQIEPSVLVEVNLLKNLKLNLGAGYRFVGDMNYRNFDQSDISGFTGYVGVKFGLFR